MDYADLPNGTQFIESGRLYVICKNWSHFIRIGTPLDDFTVVFRPDDSGLTFRNGTMPKDNIVIMSNVLSDTEIAQRNAF